MFRPPPHRIACNVAGPSTYTQCRAYAVSVRSPRTWPGKEETRTFGTRKTFLFDQFTQLLTQSSSKPTIFLQHKNFRANGLVKLRKEISKATLPKGTPLSLMDNPPPHDEMPQLNIIRTSIFGVALRQFSPLDRASVEEIAKVAAHGGLAVLTLPTLDPPKLQSLLKALDRAVPKKKTTPDDGKAGIKGKGKAKEDEDGFIPGRRQKRVRPTLDPTLIVLGALIEGRVFGVEKIHDVAKLPTLETLRAQIVGLISSPAVQLAMVLGEASGGKLARTLEGLKKGLEEKETDSTP